MQNWLNNLWPEDSAMRIASIVAVIVLIVLTIVLIRVMKSFAKAKIKSIEDKNQDEEIQKEIQKDRKRYVGRRGHALFVRHRKSKENQNAEKRYAQRFFFGILVGLFSLAIVLSLVIQNNSTGSSSLLFFGDNAVVLVRDDSMSELTNGVYDSSSYLSDKSYRIEKNSLIAISRNKNTISSLKAEQVIVFSYYDASDKKSTVKIGRIQTVNDNTYSVIADHSTEVIEVNKTAKENTTSILGVYGNHLDGKMVMGFSSLALGLIILFFQSLLGIVSIVCLLLLLGIKLHYRKSVELCREKRYDVLADQSLDFDESMRAKYLEGVWYYLDIFEEEEQKKREAILDSAPVRLRLRQKPTGNALKGKNDINTAYRLPEMRMDAKGIIKADGFVHFDAEFEGGCYMLTANGYETLPFAGYLLKGNGKLFDIENCLGTAKKDDMLYLKASEEEPLIYVGKNKQHHRLKYRMIKGKDQKRYLYVEIDPTDAVVLMKTKEPNIYGSYHKEG